MTDTERLIKNIQEYLSADQLKQLAGRTLPTTRDEDWKYTNLSALTRQGFELGTGRPPVGKEELRQFLPEGGVSIVLLNGRFEPELSDLGKDLPEGITIRPLADQPQAVQEFDAKFPTEHANLFVSLNSLLAGQGALIKIAEKTIFEEPLHIVHLTGTEKDHPASFSRVLIAAGKSSEISVVEHHTSLGGEGLYLAHGLTDCLLSANVVLHYCKVQNDGPQALHISNTRVWQERDSTFDGFTQTVGGKMIRNNLDIILNGEGCHASLNGLSAIRGSQHVDNQTCVEHRFPNCTSNQLYKGLLNEKARSVFNGRIIVEPQAQLTNSYQLNKSLLLGDDCRVDTKPQLEIFADDVKCTHGATIGQLDEDEMFYLQSRCISKKDARRMLVKGFVQDILTTVRPEGIVPHLTQILEPVIEAL